MPERKGNQSVKEMAMMTKQHWNSLSEKERNLLLKAISTDNFLRGLPTFSEYLVAKQSTPKISLWARFKNWLKEKAIRK